MATHDEIVGAAQKTEVSCCGLSLEPPVKLKLKVGERVVLASIIGTGWLYGGLVFLPEIPAWWSIDRFDVVR